MSLMRPARELPIISLEHLYARCTATDDGCLLWKGQMCNGPKTNIGRKQYKVRHLVWRATRTRQPGKSEAPMPTVCGNEHCIHPDHLRLEKRNGHARGKKMGLVQRANIAEAKRAKNAKIDMAAAQDIRNSDLTLVQAAEKHGICLANAHRIRNGQAWIDYSNPYQQLAAA